MFKNLYGLFIIFGYILNIFGQDCRRPPPIVNPNLCCKLSDQSDIAEQCSQIVGFPLKFEQDGNLWQPPNIHLAACFAECVFNRSNFMSNGNLNMDTINADIQERFSGDSESVSILTNAFRICESIAKQKMNAIQNMPLATTVLNRTCNPFPGLLMDCVLMDYFRNCPASKWADNSKCNALRDHIKTCSSQNPLMIQRQ